jgi:hypothetical protein
MAVITIDDKAFLTRMARTLRLGTIRAHWKDGLFSEEEARELVVGRLDPNDPATFVDDSALLDDPDAFAKIWGDDDDGNAE